MTPLTMTARQPHDGNARSPDQTQSSLYPSSSIDFSNNKIKFMAKLKELYLKASTLYKVCVLWFDGRNRCAAHGHNRCVELFLCVCAVGRTRSPFDAQTNLLMKLIYCFLLKYTWAPCSFNVSVISWPTIFIYIKRTYYDVGHANINWAIKIRLLLLSDAL